MRTLARKKKAEEGKKGSPEWMATFSDLMNLLLCFFVLLFSMSSIDAAKFEQVVASLTNSFTIFPSGGAGIGEGKLINNGVSQLQNLGTYFKDMGNTSNDENNKTPDSVDEYKEQLKEEQKKAGEKLYDEITGLVKANKIEQYISVGLDEEFQYIKISMYGAILFDSGKAEIKPSAVGILSKIGDILKKYEKYRIGIEGHTDNVPITNATLFKNNWWLSQARAGNVLEYFISEKNLSPKNLEAIGKGEYDPVTDNKTDEGRRKNRRVEIKIYNDINN